MSGPLPKGQQMLLQRIISQHCVTDDEMNQIFDEIKGIDEDDDIMQASTVSKAMTNINKSLTKGFGMEIVTMISSTSSSSSGSDDEDEDDDDENHNNNNNKTKYHAVIDQHACEISMNAFPAGFGKPEWRDYIRLLLEALVENGPTTRSTLINLRTDLKEPLKLDLDGADNCIEKLLEERWLSYDNHNNNKGGKKKKKNRKNDMHAKISLGPRSYLELAHLLTDLGLSQDDLPQFVFHR